MELEFLGCYGGQAPGYNLTSLRINETILIDAGCTAQALSLEEQRKIKAIFLTHSHMDHINSLPFLIENVYDYNVEPLRVYALPHTVYSIRKYLLNNNTWPDFTGLPNNLIPVIEFEEIVPEKPIDMGEVTFIPVEVNHLIPTVGYIIKSVEAAVVWSSDTGPTERIWVLANTLRKLKAVFLETSFPNRMQEIANVSYHLTPATLKEEIEKIRREVPVYLHHIKPLFIDTIKKEIEEMGLSVFFTEDGMKLIF